MLAVRGRLDNRQAIISVGVQRFTIDYSSVLPTTATTYMPIASYRALIDTGAQRTCLSYRAIANEKLVRHGKRFIKNVHDEHVHSLFMVKFGLWCNDSNDDQDRENGRSYYGLPDPIEVINIADNDRFDAIVGMDILEKFDCHFYKHGEFSIELPSLGRRLISAEPQAN